MLIYFLVNASEGIWTSVARGLRSQTMERIAVLEARVKRTSPWLLLALVIFSFGLVLPLWGIALLFDQRPKTIDGEGITTVRGRRYLWRDLADASPHAEYRRSVGGRQRLMSWTLRLRFSTGRLTIVPAALENGREVIAHIERILGRSFELPASV